MRIAPEDAELRQAGLRRAAEQDLSRLMVDRLLNGLLGRNLLDFLNRCLGRCWRRSSGLGLAMVQQRER